MARVSDAHRLARRDQIMDAALLRFADNGFHATGMAEIVAASGLSAGAVYRYFRSKEELIEAVVAERVLGPASIAFDRLLDDHTVDLADVVGALVSQFEHSAQNGPVDITRLAVQAWSEAQRNERVRSVAHHTYGTVRAHFAELVRRAQQQGQVPATADPDEVAKALLALILGYALQRLLMHDMAASPYRDAVKALLRPLPGPSE